MAHKNSVYDTDPHFVIDPDTRVITDLSTTKTKLVQGDHNSERFTFEIPRTVDGHDMSLCDAIEIHFLNISSDRVNTSADVYPADDVQVSPEDDDVVIFSWLLSSNATLYSGTLSFAIRFVCLNEENEVVYAWHTDIHSGLTVASVINNAEQIAEDYSDILNAWKAELFKEKADTLKALEDLENVKANQKQLEELLDGTAERQDALAVQQDAHLEIIHGKQLIKGIEVIEKTIYPHSDSVVVDNDNEVLIYTPPGLLGYINAVSVEHATIGETSADDGEVTATISEDGKSIEIRITAGWAIWMLEGVTLTYEDYVAPEDRRNALTGEIADGNIPTWDDEHKMFKDSGKSADDLVGGAVLLDPPEGKQTVRGQLFSDGDLITNEGALVIGNTALLREWTKEAYIIFPRGRIQYDGIDHYVQGAHAIVYDRENGVLRFGTGVLHRGQSTDGSEVDGYTHDIPAPFDDGRRFDQVIATRADEIADGNIPKWDDTQKMFVDSGKSVDDFVEGAVLLDPPGGKQTVKGELFSDDGFVSNSATLVIGNTALIKRTKKAYIVFPGGTIQYGSDDYVQGAHAIVYDRENGVLRFGTGTLYRGQSTDGSEVGWYDHGILPYFDGGRHFDQAIATRADEIADGNIPKWDAAQKMFVDSGASLGDIEAALASINVALDNIIAIQNSLIGGNG